ncbi:hypothetical protein SAMN02745126_05027 [Enhydrobacter aerosaccus]|uniref:Uncharacterized protein n=1 Tax=Enhydrobacter aerosaccus TaxID=225324 RepID=A0A1T4SRM4_9HYPH|nr:hypothetical protein [Enhydrobacter aerosaccus]SKA30802.1 hypothetical protein SAMN02745126_05027 [Enhydrobacter aerosaccus]
MSLLWQALVAPAEAVEITVDTRTVPGLVPKATIVEKTLRITGPFEAGDADNLRRTLTGLKASTVVTPGRPLTTASLSSSGGDLVEGFKVGYLFREFDVATVVRKGDSCLSACALAFLGGTISHVPPTVVLGRSVEIGGVVGFHNFYLNPKSREAQEAASAPEGIAKGFGEARGAASMLARYVTFMDVEPGFIARMLGRPSDQWEYIDTAGSFIDLKVCPIGLSPPRDPPQTLATNICNNAIGIGGASSSRQVRSMSAREAQRYLLEQVQKHLEAFKLKGPLAGQLAALLAARDDRLIEAVYSDLRVAGIPLPELLGRTYQVTGYAVGVYDLQCHVSLSLDDPDKFDLVLQGPSGLTKAMQLPPPGCPGLFAYDRDDMINPKVMR